MLSNLSEAELRSLCNEQVEILENWLRKLIDEMLTESYGDYFSYVRMDGSNLISKSKILRSVEARKKENPEKYPRMIDAVSLSNAIEIICHPDLYNPHFKKPLQTAFPLGKEMALTILRRILDPKHRLANNFSIHQRHVEQVICYSGDVIDSLKEYYSNRTKSNEFQVPQISKVTDPLGKVFTREQCLNYGGGAIGLARDNDPEYSLKPGDTLTLSVEMDSSYPADEYELSWHISNGPLLGFGTHLELKIEESHISPGLLILCKVVSNKSWHKIRSTYDDLFGIKLKVLE